MASSINTMMHGFFRFAPSTALSPSIQAICALAPMTRRALLHERVRDVETSVCGHKVLNQGRHGVREAEPGAMAGVEQF
jgi:hypothetical protein